jgi:hypothetical protein
MSGKRLATAAAALCLAQCAPAGEAPTGPAGAAEAVGAVDCIDLGAVTSRAAEDSRTIRFDTIGGGSWHNRLAERCPGLRQAARGFGSLAFDVQGGRLCRGDLVRVVDPTRAGGGYRGAIPCPLGRFEPAAQAPPRE